MKHQAKIQEFKAKFKNVLQEWCCLNKYDEYVLHHDYSISTTVGEEKCVNAVIEYVMKHGNPFDLDNSNKRTNIITNSLLIQHFLATVFKAGRKCIPKLLPDSVDKTEKLLTPYQRQEPLSDLHHPFRLMI